MKKTFIFILVVVAAFGQAQDIKIGGLDVDLGRVVGAVAGKVSADKEYSKLAKADKAYNATQPEFRFDGATVELRLTGEMWDYCRDERREFLKNSVANLFTELGAVVGWDRREIERESEDRGYYRGNAEVDQSSLPGQGTLQVSRFIAEITLVHAARREDIRFHYGKWWSGFELDYGRDIRYAGLIVKLTERKTGQSRWAYKTLVASSTTDNVGAELVKDFFSIGGGYESYSQEEALELRAQEKALARMREILRSKAAK